MVFFTNAPQKFKDHNISFNGIETAKPILDSFTKSVSFLYCDSQQSTQFFSLQWREVDYTESGSMALIVTTYFSKHSSVTEPHPAMGCAGRLVFKHTTRYWKQLCSKARTGCGSSPVCSGVAKRQLCSDHVITRLRQRLKYYSTHLGTSSISLFSTDLGSAGFLFVLLVQVYCSRTT